MNDQNLDQTIRLAQAGDLDARQNLLEMHRRPIHASVRRYLRGRSVEEIEDCVQDILLKIVSHLNDYDLDRGVKFTTWIFTFARNHCFDQLKRKRRRVYSISASSASDDDSSDNDLPGDAEPPETHAMRSEFYQSLARALGDLPDELSRIFAMREFHGLEFRIIAKRLKLPLGTVKSKHYRALERLQYALSPFRLAG